MFFIHFLKIGVQIAHLLIPRTIVRTGLLYEKIAAFLPLFHDGLACLRHPFHARLIQEQSHFIQGPALRHHIDFALWVLFQIGQSLQQMGMQLLLQSQMQTPHVQLQRHLQHIGKARQMGFFGLAAALVKIVFECGL